MLVDSLKENAIRVEHSESLVYRITFQIRSKIVDELG